MTTSKILIKGGQVYDHDGDVHHPQVLDLLIEGDRIASIAPEIRADGLTRVIDGRGKLVVPGLINAHYHSHDVLCRGLFEELPLEFWLLYTLPMGQNRSKEEIRARTLVGALESLMNGITTVQDMLGLAPLDEDYLDVVLQAYRDIGIRVVFSPMLSDIPAIAMVRDHELWPSDVRDMFGAKALPASQQIGFLEAQIERTNRADTLHWAVAPFAPQRCTPQLLRDCARVSETRNLPVYTHVYETRGQALIARDMYKDYDGSFITYMERNGLLGPRLNIVHSVWIARAEMERLAQADAGIILNHLSNLKLKSGVAPILDMREAGVRLGLGCDNCSGSDVQSMFQAMKLYCLLAAVSDPEPGPHLAQEALRRATLGNARSAGLTGKLGALKPGYLADMILIDLSDPAYLPFNSAARQIVYTESGRGVERVIVNGRIVIENGSATTIDVDALRREVLDLMKPFLADYDGVLRERQPALAYLRDAQRAVWSRELDLQRFIPRTR